MRGLYKRKETWWLRFTPAPGAAQVRISLGTHDEAEAIVKAREMRATAAVEVREAMDSSTAEVEAYLAALGRQGLAVSTISSRGYILRPFVAAMGAATPRGITRQAVLRWFEGRMARHPHTAAAYLNVVGWWFDWLVERGKLGVSPVAGIVVPKLPMQRRRRFLRPAEARRVLDECEDEGLKFALYCGLHAGLRKLEVIEALPEWFDLDAGLIHLTETATFQPKDRDKRTVPLTDEFRVWLRGYGLRSPFMLEPGVRHGRYRYRYDFRAAFEGHMERLGLGDVTFHDLRRTFASLLVSQGVSLYKVAKWLGDTMEVAEDTYGHLIPQDDQINAAWR